MQQSHQPLAAVPPLYRAQLVSLKNDELHLVGVERVAEDLGNRVMEYAQGWILRVPRDDA